MLLARKCAQTASNQSKLFRAWHGNDLAASDNGFRARHRSKVSVLEIAQRETDVLRLVDREHRSKGAEVVRLPLLYQKNLYYRTSVTHSYQI